MALTKIDDKIVMTKLEAKKRYRGKYFTFVYEQKVDDADNDLGYVIYTYDDDAEKSGIPKEEIEEKHIAFAAAFGAKRDRYVGGLTFHGNL